jgi:hypothetical protein
MYNLIKERAKEMPRLTVSLVKQFAKPRGIVVEKVGKKYEATCNTSNTTAVCSTIQELWAEVTSLANDKKEFELNFENSVLSVL